MLSNHSEERFPRVAYEADDYHKISAPHTSVLEYERFIISKALGTDDERAHPLYALDNIGLVIRVLETEGRIFLKNKKKLQNTKNCSGDLVHKAYRAIREKIASLYGGQPGAKGLLWLLDNLDSIQIITNGDKIKKTIFLMNDFSKRYFDEPNVDADRPNGVYLN